MKIDPQLIPQGPESTAGAAPRKTPNSDGAERAPATNQDSAQLSADKNKKQIAALTAQAIAYPEIRQQKVEALAQQIHQNDYQVTPQQTAAAILAEALSRDVNA